MNGPTYSNEVYSALAGAGFAPRHRVLDVGCGSGAASQVLVENAFRVAGVDVSTEAIAAARANAPTGSWTQGRAEELPFADRSFDAAISAQAFHLFERGPAIAELIRVLQPGGPVAIWWKLLASDDPVKLMRDAVAAQLGIPAPLDGLAGGFKEFYGSALQHAALRVIPWRVAVPLDRFLADEGARGVAYAQRLGERLREEHGEGNPLLTLSYLQFLYLARIPAA